jgi:serine phosphatase RsbU (regulator of sigma subunit)/pSer/pThr/pTyr-binding forkhead associated (FHA) protein
MAYLKVLKGPHGKPSHPLDKDRVLIGRNATCDIALPPKNFAVSREHARIVRSQDRFFIEDLRSRNGTYVNNTQIQGPVELQDRDEIRICEYSYTFHDPQTPSSMESILVEASISSTESQTALEGQPADKVRELIEITNNLSNSLDFDSFLPKVAEGLFRLFQQADRAFIFLREDANEPDQTKEGLVLKVFKTRRPENQGNARYSSSIVRECAQNAKALLIHDAAQDTGLEKSQSAMELRHRSLLCAPLWTRDDKAFGVIQLDSPEGGKKFTQDDLGLFMAVAKQASIALENVRLHKQLIDRERLKRDLKIASDWQRTFLPELPHASGYDFYAYYEPAQEVGGDYYDFIPKPASNNLALVLGDVAGKGVQAALFMAKLSAYAYFTITGQAELPRAIGALNDYLYQHTSRMGSFITLSAALLDIEKHTVTFVNAGHPSPLLLRRRSGVLERIIDRRNTGFPLGVVQGHPYQAHEVHMEPGDAVIIFSDGVTEAMDKQNNQLKDMAFETAAQEKLPGVKALGERVVHLVKQHAAGRGQSDDITLVAFGRLRE